MQENQTAEDTIVIQVNVSVNIISKNKKEKVDVVIEETVLNEAETGHVINSVVATRVMLKNFRAMEPEL